MAPDRPTEPAGNEEANMALWICLKNQKTTCLSGILFSDQNLYPSWWPFYSLVVSRAQAMDDSP
ncbi:hypothetical protein AALP_AAs39884U000100 [Arabis alpina]|uniref:Uncharacterized protein n=1 Tax=Arabis alpina TaxID=50452 RepID=A0A087G3B3_ARAAL|nr:hypothetical protein AALP_AAs39884U000100 [Arabis alpina]